MFDPQDLFCADRVYIGYHAVPRQGRLEFDWEI